MPTKLYVISDTHFFHENIYTFIDASGVRVRHQFSCADDGDRAMCERWNATVRPEDHVYHLGDITMLRGKQDAWKVVKLIRALHGHKRLILGNHDHLTLDVYKDAGFEKIRGSHRPMRGVIFSHIPIHADSLPKEGKCVHGHIHERVVMLAPHHPDPRYVNVSVEQINYTPVLLDSLL